jgi:hypothetical protein
MARHHQHVAAVGQGRSPNVGGLSARGCRTSIAHPTSRALAPPVRARCARVEEESGCLVRRPDGGDGIVGQRRRRWHVRERLSVGSREPQRAVRLSLDAVALLVDGAVVAPTEHREVRERGGAAVGPVADVMALPERQPAAREPAAAVAVMERAPDRRRYGARPAPTSMIRPSASCRMITRVASHARRWDVPAGACVPPSGVHP